MTTTKFENLDDTLEYDGPRSLQQIDADDIPAQNRLRAYWAAQALAEFTDLVGRDTIETAISDLICDLRHLADLSVDEQGDTLNFDALVDRANHHHAAELAGE